jgi:hypothetical protein
MTETAISCQWCDSAEWAARYDVVPVVNARLDVPHTLYECAQCGRLSLSAHWGQQYYTCRAIEHRRRFRSSLYVAVYSVACAWCGRSERLEPEEINATIANPASQRHKYDIYGCHACQRYTAISYLGEIYTYRATQDDRYHTLYYLDVEGEEVAR